MALPAVAYYSPRMGFFIQAGTDKADYEAIVNALLKTDQVSGLVLCTEATKPTTNKFPGLYIKCTDSGKHYWLDSTGTWSNGVYSGGTWQEDFYVTAVTPVAGNVFYGNASVATADTFNWTAAGSSWPNHDVYSGRASTTFATAVSNQRYVAEIQIIFDVSSANAANLQSQPTLVYLTVDGSDVSIGRLDNQGSNNTTNGRVYTFKYSGTFVTAASHTLSVKATGGHNGGVNSGTGLTITDYNLTVTLSS
jgi:hypothetical protein